MILKASEKALLTAAKHMQYASGDEILAKLGAAEITGQDVLRALYPELVRDAVAASTQSDDDRVVGLRPDQSATPATCCSPVPGERIVGIAQRGQGVMIHSIECQALAEFEDDPEKWIDLRWSPESGLANSNARLVVTMANDAGVLGRICTLIGEHRANIVNIDFTDRKPDFYRILLELKVRDIEHLTNIQTAIEADSDIAEVKRHQTVTMSAR
ncbi:MAG: bifunctional (p)ppGpp synthetase/guanosine-3',5'-bis(diphosphate) 3'-pyrophosphohydrolase [Rhodobacteraceae bacterium]|nr:bifunctional (p)ppGpp synthetase/guanosine-3',5'-bis(diphosphate) 3'-pyrophosphohydrolase [Paracoccaceae bacterium]